MAYFNIGVVADSEEEAFEVAIGIVRDSGDDTEIVDGPRVIATEQTEEGLKYIVWIETAQRDLPPIYTGGS